MAETAFASKVDWREFREFAGADLTRSFVPFCDRIESEEIPADTDPATMVTKLDHGAIEGLRWLVDGRYELKGEFGVVLLNQSAQFSG